MNIFRIKPKDTKNIITTDFDIKTINVKKSDIIIIKYNGMFKQETLNNFEEYWKKKFKRKIVAIDNCIDEITIMKKKKK